MHTAHDNPALAALRAATATLHRRVEAASSIHLDRPDLTDYAQHLHSLQAWLRSPPLAGDLQACYTLAAAPLTAQPLLRWIEADTQALAQAGIALPGNAAPPPLPGPSPVLQEPCEALGWVYLLEGSRLGGHVIHRTFSAAFPAFSFCFLCGDGTPQAGRWKTFCDHLATHLTQPTEIERTCAGAVHAFAALLQHQEAGRAAHQPA